MPEQLATKVIIINDDLETFHSGGGNYKSIYLAPAQTIALEAHTPALTRARRWLRGLFGK